MERPLRRRQVRVTGLLTLVQPAVQVIADQHMAAAKEVIANGDLAKTGNVHPVRQTCVRANDELRRMCLPGVVQHGLQPEGVACVEVFPDAHVAQAKQTRVSPGTEARCMQTLRCGHLCPPASWFLASRSLEQTHEDPS